MCRVWKDWNGTFLLLLQFFKIQAFSRAPGSCNPTRNLRENTFEDAKILNVKLLLNKIQVKSIKLHNPFLLRFSISQNFAGAPDGHNLPSSFRRKQFWRKMKHFFSEFANYIVIFASKIGNSKNFILRTLCLWFSLSSGRRQSREKKL